MLHNKDEGWVRFWSDSCIDRVGQKSYFSVCVTLVLQGLDNQPLLGGQHALLCYQPYTEQIMLACSRVQLLLKPVNAMRLVAKTAGRKVWVLDVGIPSSTGIRHAFPEFNDTDHKPIFEQLYHHMKS